MPKQLTLTQRQFSIIENLWESGIHDVSQLHKIAHISISTLYKYIKKLSVTASLKPKSHPGRPEKLTAENCIHLEKLANSRKCAKPNLPNPDIDQEQSVRTFITSDIAFV